MMSEKNKVYWCGVEWNDVALAGRSCVLVWSGVE